MSVLGVRVGGGKDDRSCGLQVAKVDGNPSAFVSFKQFCTTTRHRISRKAHFVVSNCILNLIEQLYSAILDP